MIQPSILIVEDEAVVAEDLANKVRTLGYRLIGIASTGEAALQLAQEHRPNLVLLDIRLDGRWDGIDTANRLRDLCDLPFLFITAHSDPETVRRASAAGASGYILNLTWLVIHADGDFGVNDFRFCFKARQFLEHGVDRRAIAEKQVFDVRMA
ncbi:MAG TPA: response regulator, partial [Nitrospira sp.]|nr:response regulator [Nitrospira sp.]